jgi:hypothetical protein
MASSSVPGSPYELVNITNMLSEEMWIQILSYLNQKELCTLSEVDSKFYRLARDPAVWRKECGSNLTTIPSDFTVNAKKVVRNSEVGSGNLKIFLHRYN